MRAKVRTGLERSMQQRQRLSVLGLTTATLTLRMARLGDDRADPDKVESMPRNNSAGKASQHAEHRFVRFAILLRTETRDRKAMPAVDRDQAIASGL